MQLQKYLDSLRRGWRRPEVRKHPFRAIARRLQWRLHWKYAPQQPVLINNWHQHLKIALPHTGNAALLFYRTHSDPAMAWLLQALLSPGMTFLDVGAHIGEFTLIAAKMVGEQGKVIAVEPLPPCVRAIRDNAALNGMRQVEVHEGAISERSGKIGLVSDPQRSSGWIASSADKVDFEAQCWSLDDFLPHAGAKMVHVAKLDASGNELAALQGGVMHLRSGAVRTLAMKLYNPGVVQDRFGYDFHQSLELLQQWGYQLKLIVGNNAFPVVRPEDVDSHFDPLVYCHVLVAQKTNADSFNP